jgi:hypothetical protein
MMAKNKKEDVVITEENKKDVTPNDLEWTDHVLSLLSDDEKISGNPTTDGLRRIFERALNCSLISSISNVVQSPSIDNEKRATVVHSLTYILNKDAARGSDLNYVSRSVSGAADVYWGNCDKVYRNHPVAVAETRAEGRALRRALKLRKVVAAEEITSAVEDHPDEHTVSKISNNQINFIDTVAKRLNINVVQLLNDEGLDSKNIYELQHTDAIKIIRLLTEHQRSMDTISPDLLGYSSEWK